MAFSAGDKLGSYEIVAPIGAGGMGEVYRAKDTKLDRAVAIKVLPGALAQDPDRRTRFEREAKVLASLNHPNIAQIYGIEGNALVMELVEGETLKCPAPLEYAKQIAEALEAAHEKGITHRDLKPGNIMVTPDGVVKVLDFGLAFVAQEKSGDPMNSPTLTMRATEAGMIMGTAAYMSPEQASGKPVDKRADIWSFGVVLWEMLTGSRLFHGETVSHTLADVLRGPIDFDHLPAGKIRDLTRRCLTRDVKMRLRDIGDARIVLQEVLAGSEGGTEAIPAPSRSRLSWVSWVVVGVLAVVSGGLLYNATRPAALRPLIRANIVVDDSTPLARAGDGNMLALSPDGARLALTLSGADSKVRLYTRLMNQNQVTALAGTDGASYPFFSPDNQWIGFFADGKMKKISAEGGAVVTLCDARQTRGGSWGDDGNIFAVLSLSGGLSRVPSAGGTPVPVTKLNSGEVTHRWPQVLPGGQAVLFTAGASRANQDDANIDVISLKTGERKTVARGGYNPRYLPTSSGVSPAGGGYLIYLHQSTLFAVPFDPVRLAVTGSPAPILEDVSGSVSSGGDFAFGQNGTFVYLSGKGTMRWPISWVDRSSKTPSATPSPPQPLHAPPGIYYTPRFSPDGKRLAFAIGNGPGDDIWVKDLDRDTPSRLSFLAGTNRWPVWTPDGKNMVFQSDSPAAPGLYWIRSDGSGEAQRLTKGKPLEYPYSFSPDGKRLAFNQGGNGGSQDVFTALIEGDAGHPKLGNAELFLGTPFSEVNPAFSPDGRWLAYASDESGSFEVYVRPFPGPGGRWQISTGGGGFPVWSWGAPGAGRELFFQTLDQHVMAVSYTAKGDSFTAAKPRLWTETRLRLFGSYSNYDLAPDGKRLAAMVADDANGDKPSTHLTFLLNFFDELRRRAPEK